jgi:hypothetical protein
MTYLRPAASLNFFRHTFAGLMMKLQMNGRAEAALDGCLEPPPASVVGETTSASTCEGVVAEWLLRGGLLLQGNDSVDCRVVGTLIPELGFVPGPGRSGGEKP